MLHILILYAVFHQLRWVYDLWQQVVSIIYINLSLLTHAVILTESFAKRDKQKELLLKFHQIDSFVMQKIGIPIDYATQRRQYMCSLKRRCFIYSLVSTIISFGPLFILLFFYRVKTNKIFLKFVEKILLCYCYILRVIWYHRYITFVDMIYKRYRWINERINEIHFNDLNRMEINKQRAIVIGPVIRDEIEMKCKPIDKFQLLRDIKEASLLLVEASENINETFAVSSTFCILFEFVSFSLVSYFYIEWAIKHSSILSAIIGVIQMLQLCDFIISLATECENATEEARKLKGCVHKLNINSINNLELSRFVSFFDESL